MHPAHHMRVADSGSHRSLILRQTAAASARSPEPSLEGRRGGVLETSGPPRVAPLAAVRVRTPFLWPCV